MSFLLGRLRRGLAVEDFVILCISWECFILRLSFLEDENIDSEAEVEFREVLSEDVFLRIGFNGRGGCEGALETTVRFCKTITLSR